MSTFGFALRNLKGLPLQHYRVEAEELNTQSVGETKPSHHIFIFDVSGSMYADLPDLKATVEKVLTLDEFNNPGLQVSLITYSSMGDVRVHFERSAIADVMAVGSSQVSEIRNLQVRGLTCLSQSLLKAEALVRDDEVTCISLHSDGYANDRSPSRESRAIQEAVGKLQNHPHLFVNTIAYRQWADFSLLANIANQLSGSCIQVRDIRQVYECFYDTHSLLTGDLSPSLEVGLGEAEVAIFVSKSARKVLRVSSSQEGDTTSMVVRGLSAGDDATAYRFHPVSEAEFQSLPEASPEVALAWARASISQGLLNEAKYALVSSGYPSLLQEHYRALTTTALASMAGDVETYLFDGSSEDPCNSYGLQAQGPSVLSILAVLDKYHRNVQIDLDALESCYAPRGVSRVAGVRDENGVLQEPDYVTYPLNAVEGWASLSAVEINRNTATVNLRLSRPVSLAERVTGDVINKVAGIPLKLHEHRNYTVVGDGEVTLSRLFFQTSDKRVHQELVRMGLASGPFLPQHTYAILLDSYPLLNLDQDFTLGDEVFSEVARLTVLSKILSGVLKGSSISLSGDQIAELKSYHLTPSLNFSPPTTTPYVDLQEALAKGEVDVRQSYRVELGDLGITNLSKLKSGNAYLQRRFTLSVEDDQGNRVEVKKPTLDYVLNPTAQWGVKALSARTKLDAVDALCFPIYADFLDLENNGSMVDILMLTAPRPDPVEGETREETLTRISKKVQKALDKRYQEQITPLAFYVGATGMIPEALGSQTMTAEQLQEKHPAIKLSKAEKEEGTFVLLPNNQLLSIYVESKYFTPS